MHSREQYLEALRKEYRGANRKQKKRLLNEARKRTGLNRKVLIRKLEIRQLIRRMKADNPSWVRLAFMPS